VRFAAAFCLAAALLAPILCEGADRNESIGHAGVVLPTKLLKQGSPEDVDLSLLLLEEEKLPAFNCRACSYVKRHLGQGIRSSLWIQGMPRSPTLSRRRCCDLRCETSFPL
jgi:hypothetical protein